MIHRALLLLLACLLTLAAPLSARTTASRLPVVQPPAAQLCLNIRDVEDSALTLHLDGLHDRAGPCGRVLVRQNPWSKFDPHGLSAKSAFLKMIGKSDEAAEAVAKINGRFPIHKEWAGKQVSPGMLPDSIPNKAQIAKKYPDGVRYTKEGRADFTPHAHPEVGTLQFKKGELTGEMGPDVSAARQKLVTEKQLTREQIGAMEDAGYTWHHVEGGQGLQLVPSDLHDAYKHTGGRADIKGGNVFQKAGAFFGGIIMSRTAGAKQKGGDVDTARMQDAVTYLPVVGDAIDVMGQGLDAADAKLKGIILQPGGQYSEARRMLQEDQ